MIKTPCFSLKIFLLLFLYGRDKGSRATIRFNNKLPILILAICCSMPVFSQELLIRTLDTGFYAVSYSQLKSAKILSSKTRASKIHLNNINGEVPFLIQSGRKKLSQDDNIIFFTEKLHGKDTYQHLLDDYNGFKLSTGKKTKSYKNWSHPSQSNNGLAQCKSLYTVDHLESNELLIRVNTQQYKKNPELWYWKKLSQINKKGFTLPLDFSKLKTNGEAYVRVAFRGISKDRNIKTIDEHEVNILFNGSKIGVQSWQGKTQNTSDYINIPKNLISEDKNEITFIVPRRKDNGKRILDVVMLDYIDFKYEINPIHITDNQGLKSPQACQLNLTKNQFAFSLSNNKFSSQSTTIHPDKPTYIGNKKQLKTVLTETVQTLHSINTEYLIIAHPLFIDAVKPLAEFYRLKGLKVSIVDINHIYQKYSYGVRELSSIKNMIKDTYENSNAQLKHVLLVGDSSWDWRNNDKYLDKYSSWANRRAPGNRNFVKQPHFSYDLDVQNRDFVPTGQYHSSQGHSASDNWFVSIIDEENTRGDDYLPDIAIGRFTAATIEEAQIMVEKSINYQTNSKVGPWKSRVLWITNANKSYQNFSKNIANKIGQQGVVAETIFPNKMDGDNLKVQETLSNAINDGDLIVHFVGHGGNSIWRIGPPDIKKNRDLFTLDHINHLSNKGRLPFVMSMSCYSAPYDHPFADSIGEKFFREKDKGAIAVLAASWRNAPKQTFSRKIFENIYKTPHPSLGLAIMNAKRDYKGRIAVEMYNLLGDPALHLALPALSIESEVNHQTNTALMKIDNEKFNGKVKVEFVNKKFESISKQLFDISSAQFSIDLKGITGDCHQARVYAWDVAQNIDAMSSFSCGNK